MRPSPMYHPTNHKPGKPARKSQRANCTKKKQRKKRKMKDKEKKTTQGVEAEVDSLPNLPKNVPIQPAPVDT